MSVLTSESFLSRTDRETSALIASEPNSSGKVARPSKLSLWKLNRTVVLYSCCAAFNSVLLGFDLGVMGGVVFVVKKQMALSEWQVGVVMGVLEVVAIFGTFVAGYISDRYGRTRSMLVAAILFFIGGIVLIASTGFIGLVLGRIITGAGVGIGISVDPLYISEISPKEYRGQLVTFSEISINIGITLGYFTGWVFSSYDASFSWRLMLSVGVILPLLMMVLCLKVMDETPRYLMKIGESRRALGVLLTLSNTEDEANATFLEIKEAIEKDLELSRSPWRELLCSSRPVVRRMLVVVSVVAAAQQLSGVDGIMGYMLFNLKQGGVDSPNDLFGIQLAMGVVKTSVLLLSADAIDEKYGRRKLLFVSAIGCSISHVIVAFGSWVSWAWLETIGFFLYAIAFSVGLGPVTWLFASEVLPLWARAKGMLIACSLNRLVSAIVATSFLSMNKALTVPGNFLLFGIITLLFAVFVHLCVPETKGKSLEEMDSQFDPPSQVLTVPSASSSA